MVDTDAAPTEGTSNIVWKFGWLIFLAFDVKAVTAGFINAINFDAARILLVASYIVLFPVVFVNIKGPVLGSVLIGLALNFAVISVNGGSMPIDPAALIASTDMAKAFSASSGFSPFSKHAVRSNESANLRVLSDILPAPGPLKISFSIRDVFIVAGVLMFAFAPLWHRK